MLLATETAFEFSNRI